MEKLGYWNNWILAVKYVPLDVLVGFRAPDMSGTPTKPSTFKIRRLKGYNKDVTVLSTQDETVLSSENRTKNGETITYYYRNQGALDTVLTRGYIYDIYIEDSEGNIFYSAIFVAIVESE